MNAPTLPFRFVSRMRGEAERIGRDIQSIDAEIAECERRVASLSLRRDRFAQERKELLDVIGHEPSEAEVEWQDAYSKAWLKGEADALTHDLTKGLP